MSGSQTGAFLIGAGIAILALPLVQVIVALFPPARFLIGVGLVGAGLVRLTVGEDGAGVPERINCPDCGARTDVDDDDACEYCGRPL